MTPGEFRGLTEDIMKSFFCMQHQPCDGYPNTRGYSYTYNASDMLRWQYFKLEMRNSKYQMGLPVLIVFYVFQCQYQFENMPTALHVSFSVHVLRLSTIALKY